MPGNVRVGGVWREVAQPYVRVGGTWREVDQAWTRVGGVWREWFKAGGDFELISTTTLTSNAASVTFSSIPADYKHLQIRHLVQKTANTTLRVNLNGITSSDYFIFHIRASQTDMARGTDVNRPAMEFGSIIPSVYNANVWTGGILDILDYASASKKTTARHRQGYFANFSESVVRIDGGFLNNTAAINSIELSGTDLLTAGSRFSLYGIKG